MEMLITSPFIMRAIAMNIAPIPFRLYWLLLFHKCISSDVSYSEHYICPLRQMRVESRRACVYKNRQQVTWEAQPAFG